MGVWEIGVSALASIQPSVTEKPAFEGRAFWFPPSSIILLQACLVMRYCAVTPPSHLLTSMPPSLMPRN